LHICKSDVFKFLIILNKGPIHNWEKELFNKNCFLSKDSICFLRDADEDGTIQDNSRSIVISVSTSAFDSHLDVSLCISSNNWYGSDCFTIILNNCQLIIFKNK